MDNRLRSVPTSAVPPSSSSPTSALPLFNSPLQPHPHPYSQPPGARPPMSATHFPGSPYLSATPPFGLPSLLSAPSPSISSSTALSQPAAASFDDRSVALIIRILNLSLPGIPPTSTTTATLLQPSPLSPSLLAPSPLPSPLPHSTPHSTPSPPPPSSTSSSPSPSPDHTHPTPTPTPDTAEDADTKEKERESTPYKPSALLADFAASHGGRVFGGGDVSWSSVSVVLMERVQEKRGYHYLHGCYLRLMAERDRLAAAGGPVSTSVAATSQLLSDLQAFLVQHTMLLLQRPELLPDKLPSMPRQLVSFLLSHCDRPASSLLPLLSAVVDALPSPIQLHALSHSLFTILAHDMRDMTFIHADHFKPPTVLAHLLSLPKLSASFASLPTFIYPFFNGYKIETDSLLGIFLRLTTLPDEPSVGEKFFTQPLHMTDVERLFCMGRLNRKLDKVQDVLADAWKAMLDERGEARSGLLTWVAVMLLGNWGRTRMRSPRKTTSNDGFLLGVAAIMLRVGEKQLLWDRSGGRGLEKIDAFYCLLNSRLDVREETKICATMNDEQAWLNEFWAQVPGGETGRTSGSGGERKESRSDSMDRGEELKEEKEEKEEKLPLVTQMDITYPQPTASSPLSSLSPPISDSPTPPASVSPLPSSSHDQRTSKFKRARVSLDELRSQPAQGSLTTFAPFTSSSSPPSSTSVSPFSPTLSHSRDASLSAIPPAIFPTSDSSSSAASSSSSSSSSSAALHVGDVRFSSVVDRQYFLSSSSSTHYGIVCDKCRVRDIEGTRYKCFPESDTRILTDRGFVWLKDVEAREAAGGAVRYACYDVSSGGVVYRPGELIVLDDAPSQLVVIEDEAQHVSLRVTYDHRMFVQMGESDEAGSVKWQTDMPVVMPASSLLDGCICPPTAPCACAYRRSTIRMLACAEAGYIGAGDSVIDGCSRLQSRLGLSEAHLQAFLPLCGFWLQRGSIARRKHTMGFCLAQPSDLQWLEQSLRSCGLQQSDWFVDSEEIIVTADGWYDWCAAEMVDVPPALDDTDYCSSEGLCDTAATDEGRVFESKRGCRVLPSWLLTELSAAQLRLVISGLQRAQCSKASPSAVITSSPLLLDQLMHALVLCGYSPSSFQSASSPVSPADSWTVSWSQPAPSSYKSTLCTPHLRLHESVRTESYNASRDGRIWCVRVDHPDHLIFAQRVRMSDDGLLVSQSRPLVVGQCLNCIAEGTLVALADGRSLPIEEVPKGAHVLSYCAAVGAGETEGLTALRKVTQNAYKGVKECVELLFSDGRTLVCTPDHRIRTVDGRWVEAGDLVVGQDEAAVAGGDYTNTNGTVRGEEGTNARVLPLLRVRLVGRRDVGTRRVYDLAVPSEQGDDTASFTANGVVVHNCKDFDLCASCERQTYIESLGLSQQTGVTFTCPYSHCAMPGLKERTLRDHVHNEHANDISLVACPVCAANGTAHTVLTQPGFDVHLSKEHCDDHDGQTHVLAKINKIIPHTQRKLYQPHEPFESSDIAQLVADEEAKADAADSKAVIAQRIQRRIVHAAVTCAHCNTSPIVGVAYRCLHCPDYWLCSTCEGLGFAHHGHPPAHVLAVHRRPLTGAQLQRLQPEPLMYPGAVLGSHGFNLETEWLFLTLHALRVGMMKTCSRYTSLVASIESESDARKLDSLMKVKLCVDAQLLHPRLLRDTLALYVYVSRWLASLIDPVHGGASIALPLPTCFDVQTEVLMRVAGVVRWVSATEAVKLWQACGGRSDARVDVASLVVEGGQHRLVYRPLLAVQAPFVFASKYGSGEKPVRVSGAAGVDLLLTPDHRMWVAPASDGQRETGAQFTSKRADELVGSKWRIDTAVRLAEQDELQLQLPSLTQLLALAALFPNERMRRQAQQIERELGDSVQRSDFAAVHFRCGVGASMDAWLTLLGAWLGGDSVRVDGGTVLLLLKGDGCKPGSLSLSQAMEQLALSQDSAAHHQQQQQQQRQQPNSPTACRTDDVEDEPESYSSDELEDQATASSAVRYYHPQLALWLSMQRLTNADKEEGSVLAGWLSRLSSRQAAVLLHSAASPKGFISAGGPLVHQLHALAMHAGLFASLTQRSSTGDSERYQLAIGAADTTVCDVTATFDDSPAAQQQSFWCVTTAAPSHVVLVRRRTAVNSATTTSPFSSSPSVASPTHRWQSALVGNCGDIPMEFAALPEYLIEDMADYMLFLSRFSIDTMESCDVTPLIHLFVALVSSIHYLNNPYLRAKLVEVFCGVAEFPTAHGPGCPSLSAQLTSDPFVCAHLMPSLIRLYVDIEHTGSDSQFYDKFNVRHAIAVLMKFLSDFPPHIARMEEEAGDVDLFVRFTNSIINDMIYLLDEALIKANQLHDAQANIAASRASQATFIQVNARRQEQERAAQIARSLRTAAVLATHTVNLLWTLCLHERSSAILLRPEMIDRITASINTYVQKIAGDKRDSILVKDSAACSYHHDQWLNVFTDIYLAFRDNNHFRLSIVKDNRCFSPADFQRAHDILADKKLKSPARLADLSALITQLAALAVDVQSEWDELGDVPEEFLDPILNTLMEEPVLLPSGVAMDRSVIVRHLLNKRMDPFNRQPLDVKDLREYPEMKQRIDRWKSEMRRKRAEERTARGENESGSVGSVGRRASATGSGGEAEGKSREEKEREKKREREDEEMGDVSEKSERDKETGKRKMRDEAAAMHDSSSSTSSSSASSSPVVSAANPPLLSPPSVTRLPVASSLSSSASLSSLSSIPPPASPLPLHPFPSSASFMNDGSPWLSSASQSSWQQLSAPSAVSSASPLAAATASSLALPPFSFAVHNDTSPMILASTSPSPPPMQMQAVSQSVVAGAAGDGDDMVDDRRVIGDRQ